MATMRVIRLTEADWRAFAALRLCALAESVGTDDAQYVEEVRFSGTQWRRRLRAHAQFAVTEDDQLLGLIGAQRSSVESVYLYSLWTDPAARRRGVASTLLSAAVDWARDQRVRTVTLRVDPMNIAAQSAYTGLGFTFDENDSSIPSPANGRSPQAVGEVTMTLVLS